MFQRMGKRFHDQCCEAMNSPYFTEPFAARAKDATEYIALCDRRRAEKHALREAVVKCASADQLPAELRAIFDRAMAAISPREEAKPPAPVPAVS